MPKLIKEKDLKNLRQGEEWQVNKVECPYCNTIEEVDNACLQLEKFTLLEVDITGLIHIYKCLTCLSTFYTKL